MDSGRKLKNRYSFFSFLSCLRTGGDFCCQNSASGGVNAAIQKITGQNQKKWTTKNRKKEDFLSKNGFCYGEIRQINENLIRDNFFPTCVI